jgi:hypothetical protein
LRSDRYQAFSHSRGCCGWGQPRSEANQRTWATRPYVGCYALHELRCECDGLLSLSLSPLGGEGVPMAREGAVYGPDARQTDAEATHASAKKG